jgi:hypothetical protein
VINLRRLLWRVNKCDSFLENLGTTELDEEISGVLGEIKLFLNGYQTTLKEIMGRQIMLEALYADLTTGDIEVLLEVEALEDLQTEQLQETMRFLDRIQLLATTIW